MYVYKLKQAMVAISKDDHDKMKIVTLDAGIVVRTQKAGPALPETGLIDIKINGDTLAAFRQDLEARGERIEAADSARAKS